MESAGGSATSMSLSPAAGVIVFDEDDAPPPKNDMSFVDRWAGSESDPCRQSSTSRITAVSIKRYTLPVNTTRSVLKAQRQYTRILNGILWRRLHNSSCGGQGRRARRPTT